ncbi:radical SAM enzyme, Cfr family [Chthoniobacter flavus Ellin428]|uniref:Radical SAM enzyme, Cfr family n=1 Tax=Chthoniobacter flavus Ellin428 TaxID=497964 RepID=B4DCD5_9BACT|nr:23S rRNA (adenine(2503)-C(2))-methyltransferase RlmN [Chthoniobacter flavus]EDY15884.1 radical SAM enzyme, Cfr family [Chthoniobacter flavus Ellin428]TCO87411.1 23S rRNA m(2)A-2503 methyltransferase [Chthoniobacter flavus]
MSSDVPATTTITPGSLSDLSAEELALWMEGEGFKGGHAWRVLREWLGANGGGERDSMRLPAGLRERLRATFPQEAAVLARRQVSEDGTAKLLLRMGDGRTVESVLMPDYHPERAAGCISSQVGCAMGCDFCATTQTGFERNLTSGEIVEQFLQLRREAVAAGRVLRTIVFMGMGEPMLNLRNVLAAVRRIGDPKLGAFGWRQITISTVGIVPGIDELRAADLGVQLAISLHAPDDATRADLLPMGRRFAVEDVLAAADRYQASSGRVTTIQYCLLDGVNDSLAQARDLSRLLAGRTMHVNLLRYNPTGLSLRGRTYAPSSVEQTEAFLAELRAHGTVAHLRRARGPDIDAACGQLRKREAQQAG